MSLFRVKSSRQSVAGGFAMGQNPHGDGLRKTISLRNKNVWAMPFVIESAVSLCMGFVQIEAMLLLSSHDFAAHRNGPHHS
jgi:hypothetical protein